MQFALIGNGSFQALLDDQGSVVWLCWPRFDSSFVFGQLLDPKAGSCDIQGLNEEYKVRQAYLPNSAIVETIFEGASCAFAVVDFAPRSTTERPRALIRKLRPLRGRPRIRMNCNAVYDYGRSDNAPVHTRCTVPIGEPLNLDEPVYLVLSWQSPLIADTRSAGELGAACEEWLAHTSDYWNEWVRTLRIPSRFADAVVRSAIALKLHQYEDTGAVTAATTTSIPEHPGSGRTWDYRYFWPRDAYFTVDALARLGSNQERIQLTDFLCELRGPWQPLYGVAGETQLPEEVLPHLAGYRGEGPVRIGNLAYRQEQHDIYGEMLATVCPVFAETPSQKVSNLMARLVGAIEDNFALPDAGLWEKRDTAVAYTFTMLMNWLGARSVLDCPQADQELRSRAKQLEEKARTTIEERCFREELGFFVDTLDGDKADAALFFMLNIGFLDSGAARTVRHVDSLAEALATSDGFMHRYLHDDGLGATHSTFTVCTLWYAEALALLGRKKEAEELLQRVLARANHLGLLSEDILPEDGSLWGNFPQTYSHAGIIRCALALDSEAPSQSPTSTTLE